MFRGKLATVTAIGRKVRRRYVSHLQTAANLSCQSLPQRPRPIDARHEPDDTLGFRLRSQDAERTIDSS